MIVASESCGSSSRIQVNSWFEFKRGIFPFQCTELEGDATSIADTRRGDANHSRFEIRLIQDDFVFYSLHLETAHGAFVLFHFQPLAFEGLHIVVERVEAFHPERRAVSEVERPPQFVFFSTSAPTSSNLVN